MCVDNSGWWGAANEANPITCKDSDISFPDQSILLTEKHNDQVLSTFPTSIGTGSGNYEGNASLWGMGTTIGMASWPDYPNNITGYDTNTSPIGIPNGAMGAPANVAWPHGPDGAVSASHNGMANFAFCDGHVKSMKPTATDPNCDNEKGLDMWDARRTSTTNTTDSIEG
jgi:prepilin-type processing-associated H-X9-DG protein